jgi:hypothetical protein
MEMMNETPSHLDLFATSDMIAELIRRGYNVDGLYEKMEMGKRVQTALNEINFENYEHEDGQPYKLGEVYWSKLEWIRGELEDEEMAGILYDIQETICPILNLLDND